MTNILNINRTKPIVELSNKDLIAKASSIGATQPHPGVSNKYSFIPTLKAVNFLRDAGFVPVEARQGRSLADHRDGFQRHMIKFSNPHLDLGPRRLEINLYNSHDRGCAYILSGALTELVCSNGLVVSSNKAEFRHKHIGFDADLFIESAKFVAKAMIQIGEVIPSWEAIELTQNEQGIFANAAHDLLYDGREHQNTQPEQLLTSRRIADREPNLWKTFNVIQENIIRGGMRGVSAKGRKTMTRGITNIHREKVINQALWSMADHIADIKQAA